MTSKELKAWRQKNGYSQARLAKALGVITLTVSRWERGVREIPSFLYLALECLDMKRKLSKRVVKYPKQREGLLLDKTKPEVKYLIQMKGGGETRRQRARKVYLKTSMKGGKKHGKG